MSTSCVCSLEVFKLNDSVFWTWKLCSDSIPTCWCGMRYPTSQSTRAFVGVQKVMVLAVAAAAGKKRDIMVRAVPPRGEGVIFSACIHRERDQVAHHSQGLFGAWTLQTCSFLRTLGPQGLRPLQPSFEGALHI